MTYKYHIFDKFFKGPLCLINNSYKDYSKSLLIILIYKLLFKKKNCIQIFLKNKTALNVYMTSIIKKKKMNLFLICPVIVKSILFKITKKKFLSFDNISKICI
ncbi:hypothetical protein PFMG_02158 [Plasmodium falciparum IGH-CR14]|uniref:Uncharacterized protein n=1 Tax=Plasmodium falciparum IGH-CR14 TaxID=580059 RepID=A0A0L1I8L2_PLAFA|nr:hypothetical protein PFMG_02158 [Plasmodium falciparum IGH-CR14]